MCHSDVSQRYFTKFGTSRIRKIFNVAIANFKYFAAMYYADPIQYVSVLICNLSTYMKIHFGRFLWSVRMHMPTDSEDVNILGFCDKTALAKIQYQVQY